MIVIDYRYTPGGTVSCGFDRIARLVSVQKKNSKKNEEELKILNVQPRSQGLSSYRPQGVVR